VANWRARVAALLGVSTYVTPLPSSSPTLESVEEIRKALGGQLAPMSVTQTRWHLRDLESAEIDADGGDMSAAARLMRAARKDGVYAGVLSTRTGGLVRLPKRFRGSKEMIAALEVGNDNVRSVFDEMFPPQELALLAKDGFEIGVGVGELVPVEGRDYPVLVRLDPEWLLYRWNENRWYYRSVVGLLPITPGDGRWILHTPGGRIAPWQNGAWRAIARDWIDKEHARLHKSNWEGKLANPARVAVSPQGASEPQKQSWFRAVMAWGINTVFALTPGYDVKLLESNGIGYESFNTTIDRADKGMIIAVAGQVVTTDGGAGFQNSDIHKTIRADLIKETADGLAYTLNTQGIPPWVVARWGEEALAESAVVEWDVTPPKDRNAEGLSLLTAANALKGLNEALAKYDQEVDVEDFAVRFGLRLRKRTASPADVKLEQAQDPAAAAAPLQEAA
jgi:hypothetical protein